MHLFASHYHADHYGSIDDLVNDGIPILGSDDRGRRDLVKPGDKAKGSYQDYMTAVGSDTSGYYQTL
jgi:glyoxylase-like metal-dependent hydrolase (beta-lactamase superfamily II)